MPSWSQLAFTALVFFGIVTGALYSAAIALSALRWNSCGASEAPKDPPSDLVTAQNARQLPPFRSVFEASFRASDDTYRLNWRAAHVFTILMMSDDDNTPNALMVIRGNTPAELRSNACQGLPRRYFLDIKEPESAGKLASDSIGQELVQAAEEAACSAYPRSSSCVLFRYDGFFATGIVREIIRFDKVSLVAPILIQYTPADSTPNKLMIPDDAPIDMDTFNGFKVLNNDNSTLVQRDNDRLALGHPPRYLGNSSLTITGSILDPSIFCVSHVVGRSVLFRRKEADFQRPVDAILAAAGRLFVAAESGEHYADFASVETVARTLNEDNVIVPQSLPCELSLQVTLHSTLEFASQPKNTVLFVIPYEIAAHGMVLIKTVAIGGRQINVTLNIATYTQRANVQVTVLADGSSASIAAEFPRLSPVISTFGSCVSEPNVLIMPPAPSTDRALLEIDVGGVHAALEPYLKYMY